ncbi:MAG: hypothetical protein AAGB29_05595 [Planctomycetota bacterium]
MTDTPPPPPPGDIPIDVVDDTPPPVAGTSSNASGDQRQPKRFPCKRCGAELIYAPGTTTLTCGFCGSENAIPTSADEVRELDFNTYVTKLADAGDDSLETIEVAEVRCDACAAEVTKPQGLNTFACPFCGSNIEASTHSRRLIKPKALLPFKVTDKQATTYFREWIGKLWFAPNKLKRYARKDHGLHGVYIPYWTYDSATTTWYTGQRGEHYWETQTYRDSKGKTRTRRVRKTRWYPASGVVGRRFDDVLVLASDTLPRAKTEKLEPWDLHELIDFDPAFIAGFTAEAYRVDLEQGFGHAQVIMKPTIESDIKRDIGGDVQTISSMKTQHDNVTFKHILLPIWISSYRWKDKIYRFVVNGRTGEVQGERPWSVWKILLAVLGGLIVAGGIAAVIAVTQGG